MQNPMGMASYEVAVARHRLTQVFGELCKHKEAQMIKYLFIVYGVIAPCAWSSANLAAPRARTSALAHP